MKAPATIQIANALIMDTLMGNFARIVHMIQREFTQIAYALVTLHITMIQIYALFVPATGM